MHFGGDIAQGQQSAPHDPRDEGNHDGQEKDERDHHPQRRRPRQTLPHLNRLRDLNDAVRRLQAVGAPGLALERQVRIPENDLVDQRETGSGQIHARPEEIPDLNDKIGVALIRWNLDSGRQRNLTAQRQRHLAQLIIK